jgi:UDP-N-acetyl-D-glucosamine dehydrogenase
LAYKRNTRDARESPAMRVAQLLVAMGADVRAADPHVLAEQVSSNIRMVEPTPDEVAAADAVVLLADHDVFPFEAIADDAGYVLDTRHRLPVGANVEYL